MMGTAGFELDADFKDFSAVTGIDEVGRGCLAGPVVVAAVTWNSHVLSYLDWFPDLADSKLLDPATRRFLFPRILAGALRVRVGVVSQILIDYLNILNATLHGFELVAPPFDPRIPLLIDGNQKPASLIWARTVVKGDRKLSAVAAAAIVAKVSRDQLMERLARRETRFGFEIHKGYATERHRAALARLGPTPFHRKTFRPVRDWLPESGAMDERLIGALSSEPVALRRNWAYFRDHYQLFSLAGCRKILTGFQEAGLAVLPSPRDLGIP